MSSQRRMCVSAEGRDFPYHMYPEFGSYRNSPGTPPTAPVNSESPILSKLAEEDLIAKINALPIQLSVSDVAKFLCISRSSAYHVVNEDSFPKLQLKGLSKIIIPKKQFVDWYLSQL